MIFTNTIFNTTFFSQQVHTLSFTSCLSKKLKKEDLKYFLVTDIINIITYVTVRVTHEFLSYRKLYHKDNYTYT